MSLAVATSAYGQPDDEGISWPAGWETERADASALEDGVVLPPPARLGRELVRSQLADLPRNDELINGVLSTSTAALLIGPYGSGKSAVVDGFVASVATGHDWLGRPVKQRRSLLVIGEGATGKDARFSAWEASWTGGRPIGDDQMTVLVKPDTLRNPWVWAELRNYAIAGGYGFVALDTYSSLAPDADETKDAPLVMRQLSDLAAAINGTALLVHHPGWSDANRARGGYQFEANADEVLLLSGNADDDLVCLTRKKVKDGPSGAALWLRRRAIHGSIVMELARPDEIEAPVRERLLLVLANCGELGATGPQLQKELGIDDASRSSFYKALRKATDEGAITAVGPRAKARYYLPADAPEVAP